MMGWYGPGMGWLFMGLFWLPLVALLVGAERAGVKA